MLAPCPPPDLGGQAARHTQNSQARRSWRGTASAVAPTGGIVYVRSSKPRRRRLPATIGVSGRRRVLLVEPDNLMRWSLVAYLSRWFDVTSTDSIESARQLLDTQQLEAVVVSDAISSHGAAELEAHAVRNQPGVRLVRTVTGVADSGGGSADQGTGGPRRVHAPRAVTRRRPCCGNHNKAAMLGTWSTLEKPFDLAELALLLGVSATDLPPL